jgi:small-conductance mechanosensitive channel
LVAIVVFLIFYFASKGVRKVARHITQRKTRHRKVAFILGHIAQAALIIVGLLISLVIAIPSFQPGQVVQLLGITSVAVGFAFRDVLQNFLAGLILLFHEPFRIGDQIKLGEFEGTVEEIETRATMIRTYDARRIVVPNASLFNNPITVNTAFDKRRVEIDLGIGYGDDVAHAKEVILRGIRHLSEVLKDPPPEVLVVGLAASSVTLRIRWWIQPPVRFEMIRSRDKVLEAIKKALIEGGIDLPFETQTVLFHDQTDELDGDRSQQREGWPAGKGSPTKSRSVASALYQLANSLTDRDTPHHYRRG